MPGEKKAMKALDLVNALVVYGSQLHLLQSSVEEDRGPAISKRCPFVGDLPQKRQQVLERNRCRQARRRERVGCRPMSPAGVGPVQPTGAFSIELINARGERIHRPLIGCASLQSPKQGNRCAQRFGPLERLVGCLLTL